MPEPDITQAPRRAGRALLPLLLLALCVPLLADLYIDMRWFRSLGRSDVFELLLGTKASVGTLAGISAALCVLFNLQLAIRSSQHLTPMFLHDAEGRARIDLGEVGARLVTPACVVIAVMTGLVNDRHWTTYVLFRHATPFGTHDPIFGRDIGFYVFQLPFYDAIVNLALWCIGAALAGCAGLYVLRGALAVDETGARMHGPARTHLCVLFAILFALLGLHAYFDMFDVMYSRLGPMAGASYADVHARLPALRIKVAIAAVGALLMLASIPRKGLGLAIVAGLLFGAAQLGTRLYPDFVHHFSVVPNELDREAPYLKHNIDATRAAYGLDKVAERELSARDTLTAAEIESNHDTIDNVRLWDHKLLLEAFAQVQEIRTYYDFVSIDNDRYVIDGKLRQTMLSVRELNTDSLPNRTWINERFTFTHGYGLALGPVNEATPEGLPMLFVQDIPPISHVPTLKVTRPAIYFSELSSDHVFVRTRNREFDYPSGDGYEETDYNGKDGIKFDSKLMRLMLAAKLGSIDLLLSDDIDGDSRVLMYRNVLDRIERVAPFLTLDSDPYLVVRDDGSLIWICDAYTTSTRYPYAEPIRGGGINYIRNSVKAVVDAYDGTVTLYVADEHDPVLHAWRSALPGSFTPLSKMPADIRAHLRYPLRIFEVQAEMFATFHMRNVELHYKREDQWEVPAIAVGNENQRMEPYYTVMRLPGEKRAEFILMLPFTPKRKDNLSAWMVARSDGEHMGQLVVYRLPKDRLVFGPQQVVNRINQDPEISRQISLWDQSGSQAVFGTLLVIPIEGSLVYVRPLYLRSEGGKIPELKRVIVVHEKAIAMKPSLREAVDAVFGITPEKTAALAAAAESSAEAQAPAAGAQQAASTSTGTEGAPALPAARALWHFERAISAQREGNWAQYGEELKQVESALRVLQPAPTPAPSPAPKPATPR